MYFSKGIKKMAIVYFVCVELVGFHLCRQVIAKALISAPYPIEFASDCVTPTHRVSNDLIHKERLLLPRACYRAPATARLLPRACYRAPATFKLMYAVSEKLAISCPLQS
ncbi:MAG: hypothetical protein ACJA09_000125 [Alcanivorax sp.]|jgi:hypothetical protein